MAFCTRHPTAGGGMGGVLLVREFLLGKEQGDIVGRRPRFVLLCGLCAGLAPKPRKGFAQVSVDTRRVAECRVENGFHGHSQSAWQHGKRYTKRTSAAVGVCLIFLPLCTPSLW